MLSIQNPQSKIQNGIRSFLGRLRAIALSILLISANALAQPPATDPTVDWLMGRATTAPTSQPSTQPVGVFKSTEEDGSRLGVIELSDGRRIRGRIGTTAEKPLRVWVEDRKEYQDVPFERIQTIEANVLWERDEPEWRFAASGSNVKEYSGKTYPGRETNYKLTLTGGLIIDGGVVAPLTITTGTGSEVFVLHKRDKGSVGQTLNQLVYVKRVQWDESGSESK
jgi:hypothetical protein